jgi:hydroxymethylpyrimidine kinase/phosphomethylpyrimidine kinase
MNSDAERSLPVALTIAGLDPSGGAGVIADVGTFSALACSPAAAITSLTFQNDQQMFGAEHLSAATVRAQVMAIVADHKVAGAKTGMLPTREIVRAVAQLFRETDLPAPVVDPVMKSTSGYALMEESAFETLLSDLFPLARVITPNIPEAERITGLRIVDEEGMRSAAKAIREMGASGVLIKGGHLGKQEAEGRKQEAGGRRQEAGDAGNEGREAIDVLDDGGNVTIFRGAWIDSGNVRGTGCRLSAAIAACLAKEMTLKNSVAEAKRFVSDLISRSAVRSSSP